MPAQGAPAQGGAEAPRPAAGAGGAATGAAASPQPPEEAVSALGGAGGAVAPRPAAGAGGSAGVAPPPMPAAIARPTARKKTGRPLPRTLDSRGVVGAAAPRPAAGAGGAAAGAGAGRPAAPAAAAGPQPPVVTGVKKEPDEETAVPAPGAREDAAVRAAKRHRQVGQIARRRLGPWDFRGLRNCPGVQAGGLVPRQFASSCPDDLKPWLGPRLFAFNYLRIQGA